MSADFDKCNYYHPSVGMYCGGFRKTHAERYGHPFTEAEEKLPERASYEEILNVIRGVEIECQNERENRGARVIIRDRNSTLRIQIEAIHVEGKVVFRQR